MKKYELLAPAGDFRSLRAAIDGGADARKALLFEVGGGRWEEGGNRYGG